MRHVRPPRPNAGFAWVLSLVPLSILCWFGMNNLKTVSPATGNPLVAVQDGGREWSFYLQRR